MEKLCFIFYLFLIKIKKKNWLCAVNETGSGSLYDNTVSGPNVRCRRDKYGRRKMASSERQRGWRMRNGQWAAGGRWRHLGDRRDHQMAPRQKHTRAIALTPLDIRNVNMSSVTRSLYQFRTPTITLEKHKTHSSHCNEDRQRKRQCIRQIRRKYRCTLKTHLFNPVVLICVIMP